MSSPPTVPLLSPLPIDSPPTYHTMSQHDLQVIIKQHQEQLAMMQAQIQALMAEGAVAGRETEGFHREVAKPPVFSREVGKVSEFLTTCRLYIKMRMREAMVEEQIQWVLLYVQGGSADIWKENILEDLEEELLEYELIGEFLAIIKKEFEGGDEESVKVAELKKLEQGGRTIEEFIQEFQRVARDSGYKGRLLMEEFKREMSEVIRRKLIEMERPSTSIKQLYECATNLD